MRVLIQRVSKARVVAPGKTEDIGKGLLIFVGVACGDTETDANALARKISGLRIFEDAASKMNLSVRDVGGEVMIIPQFTLIADCRHGNRPSFTGAAAPDKGKKLYEYFVDVMVGNGVPVKTGVFGARMEVELVNDGPVTIMLDSSDVGIKNVQGR